MKTLEYPNIFTYSAPFLTTVGVTNSHIIDICQQAFIVSLIPEVINHVQIKPEVPVLGEDEAELIDS